ncbi:MAG: hypothetical protein JSS11_07340 [Verrucomicrobia bacterium]|nr:hypothetical protein [Verrucomicrobiota bacterium]
MTLPSTREFPARRLLGVALLALPLLSGCRDAKVENYRIAKEPDAPPPGLAAADMASTAVPGAEGPALTWTTPAHWQAKPASAMRKATYVATRPDGTTSELAVTAFPGDVGGDLANVNRWRGQLSLPPVTAEQLPALLTRLDLASGLTATLVDLAGPAAEKPQHMLGAIVPFNGATWFFKLSGPAAAVTAEKPDFLAFVRSIKAPAASAPAAPASAPSSMASTPVPGAEGPALTWTAPADWQAKPASAMRRATYLLPIPGGGTSELAITAFPGDVGGDLANVNRWRGQLGLAPLGANELPAVLVHRTTRSGLAVTVVDFANPAAATPSRMLGAIVPFNGATWFFKLTGPDDAVAAQQPAFLAFLDSVTAP